MKYCKTTEELLRMMQEYPDFTDIKKTFELSEGFSEVALLDTIHKLANSVSESIVYKAMAIEHLLDMYLLENPYNLKILSYPN